MHQRFWLTLAILVWAGSAWATGPYVDHGNQTVTDRATGLMWDQRETSLMNWQAAMAYCEGLSHASYSDWRLPNRNELQSLIDYTKTTAPLVNVTAFPNTSSASYWTSTTTTQSISRAWNLSFANGRVDYVNGSGNNTKFTNNYVRCVR